MWLVVWIERDFGIQLADRPGWVEEEVLGRAGGGGRGGVVEKNACTKKIQNFLL